MFSREMRGDISRKVRTIHWLNVRVLFYENRDEKVTRNGEDVCSSVSSDPRWRHFDDMTRANFRGLSESTFLPAAFSSLFRFKNALWMPNKRRLKYFHSGTTN